jgi:tetratricopeptide (TPR) repeat protein
MLVAVPKWLSIATTALTVLAFCPTSTLAVSDDPPKPSSSQPKPKPKAKPKPKSKSKDSRLNQDEIYSLGYWQAKRGDYQAALQTLRSAPNGADPRVETMIGFSLRKLGRLEEAMVYYQRVLANYPERTTTRQYLGEAYLQMGAPDQAKEQLAEIGKRCGVACEDYQLLSQEIAKYAKPAG